MEATNYALKPSDIDNLTLPQLQLYYQPKRIATNYAGGLAREQVEAMTDEEKAAAKAKADEEAERLAAM